MSTVTQIGIEEYLNTSYRPDREYVDGQLVERNVGQYDHARVQAWLAMWFGNHAREWGVYVLTEIRTRVGETRVRIPDVALIRRKRPADVLDEPPVLAIEILSPEDTFLELQRRVADLQAMGTAAIWLIDPKTRTGRWCTGTTWTSATLLEVPHTPIRVDLQDMFRELDED